MSFGKSVIVAIGLAIVDAPHGAAMAQTAAYPPDIHADSAIACRR